MGNFDMSICIPGYDNSSYMPLKQAGDEDYKMSE